ncbi:hypothetical protein LRS73_28700 [Methylobacterium currus]|jgi:hypothetical protein|uniref:hypothetical protein n=1 Tax=Methylobacterium currus TaxID=2051553 RepID=UPI001E5FDEBB|nr:hypothetical protein [Methylobacterium currus]UHC19515.1 hypothetical protein LRS73_28700 [Methylobacterium currus]
MPPAGGDPPIPDVPVPKLCYTLVILSMTGNLLDIQTIFASDNEEAIILSKMLTGNNAFELWLGVQRVMYFTGTMH